MYILFITVKIVSQSQQMRAKKKCRKREVKNVDAESKRALTPLILFRKKKKKKKKKKKTNSTQSIRPFELLIKRTLYLYFFFFKNPKFIIAKLGQKRRRLN